MIPLAAMAPLALIPGATDVLSGPRRAAFRALGSPEGTGAGLLQALFGVDPGSAAGRYGGVAAEILGDPLNLLMLGGLGAVNAGSKLAQAGRVGGLESELAAARAMRGLAGEAAERVPMGTGMAGPGNLPLGSRATILPEVVVPPRRDIAVKNLPAGPAETPAVQVGTQEARRVATTAQNEALPRRTAGGVRRREKGPPEAVEAELSRQTGRNAELNAAVRAAEYNRVGREPVTGWELLSPSDRGILLEQLAGSPRLRALIPGMAFPSRMDDLAPNVLAAIQGDLAAAGAARSNPLLEALLTGGGGAFTGMMGGTRMMNA